MTALAEQIKISLKWIDAIGGLEAVKQGYAAGVRRGRREVAIPVAFSRQEKRVLRKRRYIQPSVWAERHRVLPDSARFSGLWRNTNFPYLAGILDASFERCVQEIVICAAPQTGKTETVYTCIGYAADRLPGNVMINFPTEMDAKDNAKDRIKKMCEDSPRLREYLTGYADDLGALKLTLQHMIIYMAWANSPGRLSNRPAKYLFGDEVDKYPATAGKKEGSPVDLLRKRMRTYEGLSKLWLTSSPSVEKGPIWVALTEECHAVFDYWVRCPACGAAQTMEFGDGSAHGVKWTSGVRDALAVEQSKDAWYQCKHCDAAWDDGIRDMAVRNGEWRCRKTGMGLFAVLKSRKPMRIGFHQPAWLSPLVPLYKCAVAFLKGLKDKTALKDFLNGFAAEPWRAVENERKEDTLLALKDDRPAGRVPGGGKTACLLAAVDTQDDGFWYEIRAFGYGLDFDTWAVRSGFVTTFEALKTVLWHDVYTDARGLVYPVQLAVQDAMGHRTAEVYRFCQANRGLILPTQGKDTMSQPFAYTNIEYYPGTKKVIPGGIQLVRVNTTYYKNLLSSMLAVAPGDPGCWYFNSELTGEWARQMCAEGINPDTSRWENPNNRANHAWDVSALLLVAADILGVKFWQQPEPEQTDKDDGPEIVARSAFISGGR